MIIAIDGPAGAGKSTIARMIAKKMRFTYIDTGAMYRALTLKVLDAGIDPKKTSRIIRAARDIDIELVSLNSGGLKVLLDGKNVSRAIRHPRITKMVSDIAKIKGVRTVMVELQRRLARGKNCVLEGRDTGTVVFPKAEKKFFLDADFAERVKRRHKEFREKPDMTQVKADDVAADLRNRDTIDSTRKVAPLKRAEDAIYVDTTHMTIVRVINELLRHING
ncbi:MAG: (d)CMP kinase [Candidatus Omnitrophica bacterium]|nr:(d)CMP kinase [Candidatus Omnitrophota bacterium]